MKVLHVASEVAPFAKTGGLADVVGALPRALAAIGEETAIVTPAYRVDGARFGLTRRLDKAGITLGGEYFEVGILEGRIAAGSGEVRVFLLEHSLYDRAGIYNENGYDYGDNALRFALLSRAADRVARQCGFTANVLHAHDWPAAPCLLYAKRDLERTPARTVLTIHNLAFVGQYGAHVVGELGLGADLFHPGGIEFYGGVSFLKAGIQFADRITTVSPRYAEEMLTPELGCGLDGVLREKAGRIVGILNGIDYEQWNPANDPALAARYDASALAGKHLVKASLQRHFGLPEKPRTPLCGGVSRLTDQKGFDLVADALEGMLSTQDVQCVILGAGDPHTEGRLRWLASRFPNQLAVHIGYDEQLAHRIYGGSDLFLMPSRYEPCGLGQLYALRYGTVPLVRDTGGLHDTVIDFDSGSTNPTGFKFAEFAANALAQRWRRALTVYENPDQWTSLMRAGMAEDYSWEKSARSYAALYRTLFNES